MPAPAPLDRCQPVTIITPMRWWGTLWLLVSWPFARGNPLIVGPLLRLRFIHRAHWAVVLRRPGRRRPLRWPLVVFSTNFSGDLQQYIDAFALRVAFLMGGLYRGAVQWPGTEPTGDFKRFVLQQALNGEAEHYYSAYHDASVNVVVAALQLRDRVKRLHAVAPSMREDAFERALERLVAAEEARL